MSTKCGFCKGTKVEPGHANCVWCNNTGVDGGIVAPSDLERVTAERDAALAENKLLRHDVASYLETVARICDMLGVDLESAKTAEGKPSDVLFGYVSSIQQRLTAADERADGFDHRIARLRHVGMELMGVIDEYRAMPCDSLKVRMFQTADRYRKRLTAKCGNCEDHGVIGYTTGQTPETFDQGEYPCPECHPTEYAAWRKP